MKSIKTFLFCIGTVVAVLFGIAVSMPTNFSVQAKNSETTFSSGSYDSQIITESTVTSTASQYLDEETVTTEPKATTASESVTSQKNENTADSTTVKNTEPNTGHSADAAAEKRTETTTAKSVPKTTVTTAESQTDEINMTVYITKTGEHYHYKNPCGRGTYYPVNLSDALSRGLTPCQKCVH